MSAYCWMPKGALVVIATLLAQQIAKKTAWGVLPRCRLASLPHLVCTGPCSCLVDLQQVDGWHQARPACVGLLLCCQSAWDAASTSIAEAEKRSQGSTDYSIAPVTHLMDLVRLACPLGLVRLCCLVGRWGPQGREHRGCLDLPVSLVHLCCLGARWGPQGRGRRGCQEFQGFHWGLVRLCCLGVHWDPQGPERRGYQEFLGFHWGLVHLCCLVGRRGPQGREHRGCLDLPQGLVRLCCLGAHWDPQGRVHLCCLVVHWGP